MSEYPTELIERELPHRPAVEPGRTNIVVDKPEQEEELPPRDFSDLCKVYEQEHGPMSPIECLMWRKELGYRGGIDKDLHKIGVAMEPGGASGIVSFTEAYELARQGLLDCVDGIYGLSVGNVNAIYAATGQWRDGFDVYREIMTKDFAKWFGLKIDIGALERAITVDRPLDMEKFKKLRIPVGIGVSRLTNFKKIMVKSTDPGMTPDKFVQSALRGCHIPGIAGPAPVDEEGMAYSDATFAWESSVEIAQSDGCDLIVSLANALPVSERPVDKKHKIKDLPGRAVGKVAAKVADMYINSYDPNASPEDIIAASSFEQGRYEQLMRRKKELLEQFQETRFEYKGADVEKIFPVDPATVPGLRELGVEMPGLVKPELRKYEVGMRVARLAVSQVVQKYQAKRDSLAQVA